MGEAATLAEQGERLLGNDTERLPALGGIGVPRRRLEVAAGLGEGGAGRHQSVLGVGRLWLDPGHEPVGELGIAECERGANHRGQEAG